MASFNNYIDTLLRHEGGFVNHPSDPGGATNKGITLNVWRNYGYDKDNDGDVDVQDLKLISSKDAADIYKRTYWDRIWGDKLNQQVAEIVVDFAVNSGVGRSIKMTQYILNAVFAKGLAVDGRMGPNTFKALNSVNQKLFFENYKKYRYWYYQYLTDQHHNAKEYGPVPKTAQDFFRIRLGIRPQFKLRVFWNGWLNRITSFSWGKALPSD